MKQRRLGRVGFESDCHAAAAASEHEDHGVPASPASLIDDLLQDGCEVRSLLIGTKGEPGSWRPTDRIGGSCTGRDVAIRAGEGSRVWAGLTLDGEAGACRGGFIHCKFDVSVCDYCTIGDVHAIEADANDLIVAVVDQFQVGAVQIHPAGGAFFHIIIAGRYTNFVGALPGGR